MLLASITVACGCERKAEEVADAAASASLREWFRQTQADVETPHGRIEMDSVREDGDAVVYRTEQGVTVRVPFRPDGRGGFEPAGGAERVAG